jgi:hypothetical protein
VQARNVAAISSMVVPPWTDNARHWMWRGRAVPSCARRATWRGGGGGGGTRKRAQNYLHTRRPIPPAPFSLAAAHSLEARLPQALPAPAPAVPAPHTCPGPARAPGHDPGSHEPISRAAGGSLKRVASLGGKEARVWRGAQHTGACVCTRARMCTSYGRQIGIAESDGGRETGLQAVHRRPPSTCASRQLLPL